MKRSTDRILTTHTGSLPRPDDLLGLLWAKEDGNPGAEDQFRRRLPGAVAECVRQQVDAGIDIPSDGEFGKTSVFNYIVSRVDGFEVTREEGRQQFPEPDFPGFPAWRNANRMAASRQTFWRRAVCVGP